MALDVAISFSEPCRADAAMKPWTGWSSLSLSAPGCSATIRYVWTRRPNIPGDQKPTNNWLVVYQPLWKIWVRQLGWWHYQLNGQIKHVPNHQPDKRSKDGTKHMKHDQHDLRFFFVLRCLSVSYYPLSAIHEYNWQWLKTNYKPSN